MDSLAITDYGSIPNGLFHFAPPGHGRVTFDIEWSGVTSRQKVRNADPSQRFGGEFATTSTHASWKGWSPAGTLIFESSDDGQTSLFGQVGHEFNGAFFPG